jgi:hypothetical protein
VFSFFLFRLTLHSYLGIDELNSGYTNLGNAFDSMNFQSPIAGVYFNPEPVQETVSVDQELQAIATYHTLHFRIVRTLLRLARLLLILIFSWNSSRQRNTARARL